MGKTQWILKLLSGPHAGAEMQLDERVYRVGRSEDCDVVIHDETLPGQAFSLEVGESGIQLKRLDSAIKLLQAGQPRDEECLDVQEFEVYSAGLLHFCFGAANAQWPELKLPGQQLAISSGLATEQEDRPVSAVRQQAPHGRSKVLIHCSIFVFLVTFGVMFSSERLDAGIATRLPEADVAEAVHQELNLPALKVTKQSVPDQTVRWLIGGYVQTATELEALRDKLQSLGVVHELDVRVMETIAHSAEVLLKQLRLNQLLVSVGEVPGELLVRGVQPDLAHWERAKRLLLSDIPGLKLIVDQVESVEGRISMLKQWIQEEGLDQDVIVNAASGRLTITSEVELETSEAWAHIKAKFEERFGSSIELTALSNQRPSMAIRSVSLGSVPYLVLANGRRYSKGSHVGHGYYLDQIHEDSVLLKRGDELLKYPVGLYSE